MHHTLIRFQGIMLLLIMIELWNEAILCLEESRLIVLDSFDTILGRLDIFRMFFSAYLPKCRLLVGHGKLLLRMQR